MTDAGSLFSVPSTARAHLHRADPVLAAIVARIGPLEYRRDPDLWSSLVGSIVGQQLSTRAAATIRARIAALGGETFPGPEIILATPDEVLRGCGLSRPKLGYLRGLAQRWVAGEIRPDEIGALPDEEVIARLVQLRGVGRWTAEMVLIFCLGRPDVLAVDDLGIRVAAQNAYGLPERPDAATLRALAEPWVPYRSFASLYLWRSLTS